MKVEEDIRKELGKIIDTKELSYSQYATKNNDSLRKKPKNEKDSLRSLRSPFFRDADKIIQSKAYARYIDKTQVFFLVENDHVTHRVLHVQLVSKIARTIGRALRLNEDLIEAISLGHDIGHVPYGHLGEGVLSKLCEDQKIGKFLHNVQSIQFLDTIEDCNLTLQVLDGILCHDGEIHNQILKPTGNADWDAFDSRIKKIIANKGKKGKNVFPLTMEGCVVRMADTIAYLGRDIKDAVELKLIPENLPDFPEKCRKVFGYEPGKPGKKDINRAIVDTLIKDVINNSLGQDTVSISSDVSKCVLACRDFNYKYIYKNKYLLKEENKINMMYSTVFKTCINDLKNENKKSLIYSDMLDLNWISSEYKQKAKPAEIVRDYIAGMTDRYFERVFIKMTVPERIIGGYNVDSSSSENIISSASG